MKLDIHLRADVSPTDVRSRLTRALHEAGVRVQQHQSFPGESRGAKQKVGRDPSIVDVLDNLRVGIVELDPSVATEFAVELSKDVDVREVSPSVLSSSASLELIRPTRIGGSEKEDGDLE